MCSFEEGNKRGWCYIKKVSGISRFYSKYFYPYEGQGESDKYKQLCKQTSLEWFLPDERLKKHKRKKKKINELMMRVSSPPETEIPIPDPLFYVRPTQAVEDKLDKQTDSFKKEIRLLREELKQSRETNLVKNVKTRKPNIIRPTKFDPPTTNQDPSLFAEECIYWFKEEHGELPVLNELWRLIKAIASHNEQVIQGFFVEMVDRKTVRIEESEWKRENCRKYFNDYLK